MKFDTSNRNKNQEDQLDLRYYNVESLSDMVELEKKVLPFWEEHNIVELAKEKTRENPRFSFFDGPVTANNPLGVHHAWGRTLKDVVQRFKQLEGYHQRFEYGFDTQGLWVEVEVEKALGFNSKKELEEYGVDQFVEDCKQRVRDFSRVQDDQSLRLGMLKSKESYYTHSDENVSAIWTFLKQCQDKGWLYKGYRPMPWCPRCGTSLSAHEQADAYKDVTHTSVYAKFKMTRLFNENPTYLLVWTTTPWTLPANLAVGVNPALEYGYFEDTDGSYLLAGAWLADTVLKDLTLVKNVSGQELVNLKYTTAFASFDAQTQQEYRVHEWSDVNADEGTGVVHLAPGCGREDYDLLSPLGYQPLSPLNENGTYTEGYGSLSGQFYQDVNHQVVTLLEEMGLLFHTEDYFHRYPHCWRCKTELVYRLVEEWFLSVDEVRPLLLKAANNVEWDPDYTKKLFTDWVNNMGDWCVSRKRYWGLPLPFYECQSCDHLTVVSSKEEFLANAVGPVDKVQELHLPWVDKVQYPCDNCGTPTTRVKEVGDCWLDAGVMSFSTTGYFDGNRDFWKKWFPADFVCEMREQTRLWFYSMMFLSVTLVGQAPFKSVVSYEKVKDKNNQEMHKSGKNNVVLDDALDRLGADVLRLYYLSQSRSSNMRFDFDVGEQYSRLLMTLYHSFSFFQSYADLEEFSYDPEVKSANVYDRWMLSRVDYYSTKLKEYFDQYNFQMVVRQLEGVVNELSSWYLRRVRDRVWNKAATKSDMVVYHVLFKLFHRLSVLFASVTPYFSELLYQSLKKYDGLGQLELSVHLETLSWEDSRDVALELQMDVVMVLDELNRKLRNQEGCKLRQPLSTAYVWLTDTDFSGTTFNQQLFDDLKSILNVQNVKMVTNPEEYVEFGLKPNYKVLGPQLGKEVKTLEKLLEHLDSKEVTTFALNETSNLTLGDLHLSQDELVTTMTPRNDLHLVHDQGKLLLLDFHLTKELEDQGNLREFSRHVQQYRKDLGLELEERVDLVLNAPMEFQELLKSNYQYLTNSLYLRSMIFGNTCHVSDSVQLELDGFSVSLQIKT